MTPLTPLRASLPADPAAIPDLADRIAAYCTQAGIAAADAHAINLALDELLTTVIDYGMADVADPAIAVTLQVDAGRLVAEVSDNGAPFDPFSEAEPPDLDAGLDARPIGGLGVHLVTAMMDEVQYRYEDNLNRITLIKSLDPGTSTSDA